MNTIKTADYRIDDGTTFIIFDLEWNQPIWGKEYDFDISNLKGEIIDIGAEKYVLENGKLRYAGAFSKTVRPEFYRRLHYHVQKLTHKTNRDIERGISFVSAYNEFQAFCGEDYILVGWGQSDPEILKQNLKISGLDDMIRKPFIDLQPIFARYAEEKGKQRSVEYAVDYLDIDKEEIFHSAWADSRYTGQVFKAMFDRSDKEEYLRIIASSLVDPDNMRDFSFVSTLSDSEEDALEASYTFPTTCPFCNRSLTDKMGPVRIRKSVYAIYSCSEHGDYYCRTRIKRGKQKKYYSAMILRFASQTDMYLTSKKLEEFEIYGVEGKPFVREVAESSDDSDVDSVGTEETHPDIF